MGFVVQSLSSVWLLQPHELQHTSLFCSSPSPRACLNSCPLNQLCRPTVLSSVVPVLLPSIFPSIKVFYNESALCIRWPKFWSFSFSISPSNEYSGLISFRIDWFDLVAVQGTLKSPRWLYKVIFPCSTKSQSKYVLLWHLVKWRQGGHLEYPNNKFPSHSTPQVSFLSQVTLLISYRTNYTSHLSPSSRLHFLASSHSYSNQPIFQWETTGVLPSGHYKGQFQQYLFVLSVTEYRPHMACEACDVLPPSELWVSVINKLLWFICPVLGVSHPHSLKTGIPLPQTQGIRGSPKP